jgi:periplasmic copper chaperone A
MASPPFPQSRKSNMAHVHGLVLAALASFAAVPALAQEFKAGEITIDKPWSRATPKGAGVAVGFLVVHNHGATADKLTGGAADFAGAVSVHQMSMDNGVMRMRELTDGLEIPAKSEVKLAPAGYHLMFTGLKRQLKRGESVKADLTFEHAGSVSVTFAVGGFGDGAPGGAARPEEPMKGMKM